MCDKYTVKSYEILTNNCIAFSDELSRFLVGVPIPEHVSKLAQRIEAAPNGRFVLEKVTQMYLEGFRLKKELSPKSAAKQQPYTTTDNSSGRLPVPPIFSFDSFRSTVNVPVSGTTALSYQASPSKKTASPGLPPQNSSTSPVAVSRTSGSTGASYQVMSPTTMVHSSPRASPQADSARLNVPMPMNLQVYPSVLGSASMQSGTTGASYQVNSPSQPESGRLFVPDFLDLAKLVPYNSTLSYTSEGGILYNPAGTANQSSPAQAPARSSPAIVRQIKSPEAGPVAAAAPVRTFYPVQF